MKMLKKTAMTIALGAAFVTGAHADVLSQSVLIINNFLISNTNGTTLNANQFSLLVPTDSGDTSASLTVGGSQSFASGPSVPGQTFDVPTACVGNCVLFSANDFSSHYFPPTTTVARGDALLQGAPIAGLVDPGTGVAITTPANANTVAEVQLTSSNAGSATSNLDLTTDFTFALNESQAVVFSFDALIHVLASKDVSGLGAASSAFASWTVNITDEPGNDIFSWTPDGVSTSANETDQCDLTVTRSRGAVQTGSALYDCNGLFSNQTGVLAAGTLYTLSIRHTSLADGSQAVPEPGSLALVGLGILGLAALRRRGSMME